MSCVYDSLMVITGAYIHFQFIQDAVAEDPQVHGNQAAGKRDDDIPMTAMNGDLDPPPEAEETAEETHGREPVGNAHVAMQPNEGDVIEIHDGNDHMEAAGVVNKTANAKGPQPGVSGVGPPKKGGGPVKSSAAKNTAKNVQDKGQDKGQDKVQIQNERNKILSEVKDAFEKRAGNKMTPNERWGAMLGSEVDTFPEKLQENYKFYAQGLAIAAKRGTCTIPEADDVMRGDWRVKFKKTPRYSEDESD